MAETEIKKINGRTLSDDFARNEIKQLKESVEDLPDSYSKTESDEKYQPKGNYLTEHQDLSEYAKTDYVDSEIEEIRKQIDSGDEELKKLKFTGAVNAEYNGSEEVTVNIPTGGSVDSELSTESENPVQNKVISKEINNLKESAQQIMSELLIAFYTKEQINEMLGTYVEEVASLVGGDA